MSGLYVNTNVNSMIAATNLTKNMGNLSDVLTKLSTGLRINSAKDDPAGLIASEILRSEITASTSALKNTNRAIGMIGMADSALSQVGDLLNDIRGLVNEAANTGAMSEDQINANQLQIDASLDAIDRIAQSTTYMGKKLLDGSMAFQTANLDKSQISNLVVNSANFGTQDSVHVQIDVQAASTAASQVYTKGALGKDGASVKITGSQGSQTFNFGAYTTTAAMAEQINAYSDSTGVMAIAGDEASAGIIDITSAGADNDIILEAKTAGEAAGNYSVKYTAGSSDGISYTITEGADGCPSTINFQLKMDEWKNASGVADEAKLGIYDKETASGLILSSTTGSNVKQINWVMDGASGITDPTVVFDNKTGIMTITYDGASPPANTDIEDAINAVTNLTGVKADASGLTVPTVNEVESTSDLRANNGLTLTAKTGDVSMNGTGIVVVGNVNPDVDGVKASAVIAPGAQGLKIEASAIGEEWNGFTISFAQGTADDGSATAALDAASKTITVTLNNGGSGNDIAYSDIATAIGGVDISAITGDATPVLFSTKFAVTGGTDEVADGDPMPDSTATSGGKGVSPAVDFDYVKTAQAASAVYKDNNGNYVQFKATDTGSKYNDYTFNFVNDDSVTNLGVALDEKNKIITITANFGNNGTDLSQVTYAQLADAVNGLKNSEGKQLFQMAVYKEDPTNNTAALKASDLTGTFNLVDTTGGSTKTGTMFGQIGTDAGALIITLNDAAATPTSTAQDVIDAFNATTASTPEDLAKLKELQAMFSLTGVDGAGTDGAMFLTTDITLNGGIGAKTLSYSNALQGGSNGNVSNTTAKELVDFINNDAKLSEMFNAYLAANSQTGAGKLTLFDEVALYGCPYDETGLQFLGPANSQNIEFSTTDANGKAVKNQALSVSWTPDTIGDAKANLAAYNANASLSLEVLKDDDKYNDMVVRYKRVVEAPGASSVTYTSGPSNAMAYGSISSDNTEINAKFIFEALEGGDRYNNLAIKAKVDGTQQAPATFALDEATGEFMITVNSTDVTLAQMMDAFNQSDLKSQFKFELDYSDAGGTTNDGSTKFSSIIKNAGQIVTIGNTGSTGGHTGGVLEIQLFDDGTAATAGNMTAKSVVDLVNNSELKNIFRMNNYAGSDGTGNIHARYDTVGDSYDPQNCSGDTSNYRMITTGGVVPGHMVVHLATDAAGNSTTTAADLVAYFDTLTAEQTKGISVSLINAGGNPGTICDTSGGNGILQPTRSKDDCDNLIDNDIRFGSSCSETKDTTALSEIVAVNGKDAGFTLFSKKAGTDYEGIKMVYQNVDTQSDIGAKYDETSRTLTVKIQDGVTTASTVKELIEKTGLFTVKLRSDGTGTATVNDDSISLTNGSYETKPKGGATMLWNRDDASNELYLESVENGSKQFVQVDVLNGSFDTVDSYTGQKQSRSYGTDIEATANGQKLQADGNNVSLNTTNLSFTATINADAEGGDSYGFDIVSGGALFQLGPDVVSAQQVHLGIPSVMTTDLGGSSGFLSDLRSGGKADLSSEQSVKLADRIVKDAITSVANTRGRLGAIQKATLESNVVTLENSIEALTSARADIIDTDFAAASAELTKYQILVQSGSRVLAIANQLPQYAASLIG